MKILKDGGLPFEYERTNTEQVVADNSGQSPPLSRRLQPNKPPIDGEAQLSPPCLDSALEKAMMIDIFAASAVLAAVFCGIQILVVRKTKGSRPVVAMLGVWGFVALIWILAATVAPREVFAVLSAVPEKEYRIEDGLEIFLIGSYFFLPLFLLVSGTLAALGFGRKKNLQQNV